MASETEELGPVRDFVIPIILLVVGAITRFGQVLAYAGTEKLTTGKAIVLWVCELVLGAAAMLGGVLAMVSFMSLTFGPPGRAVLKVLALWLIAAAAGCFVAKIDADPMNIRGIVLAFHVVLLVYFAGFATLFSIDVQEALMTAVAVTVVQGLLLFGIAKSMSPDAARALFFG
jgi:hypothetical protein